MAIILEKTYPQGYTATYHRIKEFETVRIDADKARVIVATYMNKNVRDANPDNYIELRAFDIALPKASLLDGTAFEEAYEALLALPEFDGGEGDE
jgi:hypothetical protein